MNILSFCVPVVNQPLSFQVHCEGKGEMLGRKLLML